MNPWTQDSSCPLCGVVETIQHALTDCLFHKVIFATLKKTIAGPETPVSVWQHSNNSFVQKPLGDSAVGSPCGSLDPAQHVQNRGCAHP